MNPTRHRSYLRAAVLGALLGALVLSGTGCIVLPIPSNRLGDYSRKDIPPEVMIGLVVGQTTREEVLLRLGEPDEWSADARHYRYHWERVKWDIIVIAGGGYSATAGDIPINKNHDLVIGFDSAGVISDKKFNAQFKSSEQETRRQMTQ